MGRKRTYQLGHRWREQTGQIGQQTHTITTTILPLAPRGVMCPSKTRILSLNNPTPNQQLLSPLTFTQQNNTIPPIHPTLKATQILPLPNPHRRASLFLRKKHHTVSTTSARNSTILDLGIHNSSRIRCYWPREQGCEGLFYKVSAGLCVTDESEKDEIP